MNRIKHALSSIRNAQEVLRSCGSRGWGFHLDEDADAVEAELSRLREENARYEMQISVSDIGYFKACDKIRELRAENAKLQDTIDAINGIATAPYTRINDTFSC